MKNSKFMKATAMLLSLLGRIACAFLFFVAFRQDSHP